MGNLRNEILEEAHVVAYAIHLGATKMYHDLKAVYWSLGLKRYVAKKYVSDPSHVIRYDEVQLQDGLSYEEQPIAILDRQVKRLRSKNISMVKVLWQSHAVKEAAWELEQEMRVK
ncbi:PREDICTED: uncharacterized protein LOC108663026 [Theobroma cacao]|uniref:Uncharacterized protein LOC108663026 n=1 Tax=Theobroma cacao TaxID=3641 RepID=A0AB32WRQ8_THECC|nr:PREDICTED: uncharacterized protein LOC108663026 [Theobroma cacao]